MRAALHQVLCRAWALLRAVSGDSAYEAHAERARRRGQAPLTREQHYLEALRRRYSGASRCC